MQGYLAEIFSKSIFHRQLISVIFSDFLFVQIIQDQGMNLSFLFLGTNLSMTRLILITTSKIEIVSPPIVSELSEPLKSVGVWCKDSINSLLWYSLYVTFNVFVFVSLQSPLLNSGNN